MRDPEALCVAAHIIALPGGDLEEGIAIVERSLAQNSNSAEALAISAMLHAYLGHIDTAFGCLERANSLTPLHVRVTRRSFASALTCFVAGDYQRVIDWTGRDLLEKPRLVTQRRYRAAAFGLLGRLDEARQVAADLLEIAPGFTISRARYHIEANMKNPFKRPGVVESYYEGLRRAGIPE